MHLEIPAGELETYAAFLDEAGDHLESIEQKVLGLAESGSADVVHGLFRALHTIKGVASFLGLSDIQRLSHHLESVFDRIRLGALAVDGETVRICLGNLDNLKAMLAVLQEGLDRRETLPDRSARVECREVDYQAGFLELERLLTGKGPEADGPAPAEAPGGGLISREMEAAFLKEGGELLEGAEQAFLRLSGDAGDPDDLPQAFRNVHTFKSNCGFFGYAEMERVSHRLETLLDAARSGEGLRGAALEASLRCIDALRAALSILGAGGAPVHPDLDRALTLLESIHPPPLGEILVEREGVDPERIQEALEIQARPLGRILVEEGMAPAESVERALEAQATARERGGLPPAAARPAGPARDSRRDLRVDLAKLDLLLDLVGELVISTGMVFNHPVVRGSGSTELEKAADHLKGVVNELQNVALGVRMIPVEGPFRKMTRLVHDLSSKSGKKVKLEFKGEETEIDKNVADLIADPLVHMIRNSLDHGLEHPAERERAGKSPLGTLSLEAGQDGGDILITVRDDGRGLDRERILRKARQQGLAGDEADALKDEEVFQFIFLPGFSTAEAVTATSGRGVGMDVVKSNIDRLNGRIDIRSMPGQGAAITMRIPLTLSILDGMMVRVGDASFLLPLGAVRESLRPTPGSLFRLAGGQEMIHLRGRSLPIVRLHRIQGIAGARVALTEGILVCVEAHGIPFCLFVDELLGQRQTVVKALPGFLGRSRGVSSCSILDDGAISLILDLAGLFELHQAAADSPGSDLSIGSIAVPEPQAGTPAEAGSILG